MHSLVDLKSLVSYAGINIFVIPAGSFCWFSHFLLHKFCMFHTCVPLSVIYCSLSLFALQQTVIET